MDFLDMNPIPEEEEEPEKEEEPTTAIEKVEIAGDLLSKAAAEAGVVIPKEKAEVLRQFLRASRYGHQATLSMKCKGLSCPFIDLCPLHAIEADLPIGKKCPVENALIEQWVSQFMESLNIDPDDPGNSVEMHMVYELAGLELIRRRAAYELSKQPELIKREIVGYSPQGDPIFDDKPSQALLILERHSKIVNKLRESLLATPKAQAQAGQASRDLSSRTAHLMEKAKEVRRQRQEGKSIQDAEFAVINAEQKQNKGSDPEDEPKYNSEDSYSPSSKR